MKQIASLDVKAGGGKAQLRFIFSGGHEAAGCILVGQRCGAVRRRCDAADAGLPPECFNWGWILVVLSTLLGLYFGNTSANQYGEGWPKVATLELRR